MTFATLSDDKSCPTCGAPVRVEGKRTKYYVPQTPTQRIADRLVDAFRNATTDTSDYACGMADAFAAAQRIVHEEAAKE